jgi:hypothetical protein
MAALAADRRRLGWALLVAGSVNTPASFVGLLFVSLWYAWTRKRLRHLLPVAATAALLMLESWVRRGGPLVSGYEGSAGNPTIMPFSGLPGFSYPLFFGVLSIVLSFGKGLLFFSPGLIVRIGDDDGVSNRLVECYRMWMVFLAGLILVYAKWWAWYGGWTWGPRFFLFASLPASLAVAIKLRRAQRMGMAGVAGLATVIALSAWVAIDGAVFEQSRMELCLQNKYALEFLCWYTPEFSALWRPFVAPSDISVGEACFGAYAAAACAWLLFPLGRRVAALVSGMDRARVRSALGSMRF